MLDTCQTFEVLTQLPPASESDINLLRDHFGSIPFEYHELIREASELELIHQNGQYIRIWSPAGCIEMDRGYGIRQRLPGSFPIGDDGGGQIIFFAHGEHGWGLYHVGYGNLDLHDATWIAPSLKEFLARAVGIDAF